MGGGGAISPEIRLKRPHRLTHSMPENAHLIVHHAIPVTAAPPPWHRTPSPPRSTREVSKRILIRGGMGLAVEAGI